MEVDALMNARCILDVHDEWHLLAMHFQIYRESRFAHLLESINFVVRIGQQHYMIRRRFNLRLVTTPQTVTDHIWDQAKGQQMNGKKKIRTK